MGKCRRFQPGQAALKLCLFAAALVMVAPVCLLVTGSLMGEAELLDNLGFSGREGWILWPALPAYPSLTPYVRVLMDTPRFLLMFWNSCTQVVPAVLGQFLVGAPAAWAFGRYTFPGKRVVFLLYIALMLMPFQVTMVSNYLVLNRLGLMNNPLAIILPAAFSTFPVFIMVKFFAGIPQSVMDAAELDAAGPWSVFWRIGLPMGAPGVGAALMLGFLESWNAIEQPMIFLMQNKRYWPLSLYLPEIAAQDAGVSLAASVIMMIPPLLVFLFGLEYLELGICAAALKE